jgi:hypothetical protein
MKAIITAVIVAFASLAVQAAEPSKKEEQNCVKKDKKGNCPATPKSPKPTPKKKAEAK